MHKPMERSSWGAVRAVALGISLFSWGFGLVPAGYGQDDYIGRLLADLKDPKVEVRIHAVRQFGDYNNAKDPRVVAALIAALKDPSAEVRQRAATSLRDAEDPRSVDPLISALADPDAKVRMDAADGLGAIKNSRAFEPLLNLLRSHDQPLPDQNQSLQAMYSDEAQRHIGTALCEIDGSRAVEPLLALLKDPDVELRNDAAWALGTCKDPRAVEPLISTLKDAAPSVRPGAAVSLGQCKAVRSVEPLIGALKDRDDYVQAYAVIALGQSRDPRAVAPLIALLKAPSSDKWSPAEVAIGALGENGDPLAVDALLALLKGSGPSLLQDFRDSPMPPHSQGEILFRALGKTGDPRAVEPLIPYLHDESPYVQRVTAYALSEIKDRRTTKILMKALNKHSSSVIAGAYLYFIGLGKAGSEDALIEALNTSGDEGMASLFEQSGNAKLAKAGREWSPNDNFPRMYLMIDKATRWGFAWQ